MSTSGSIKSEGVDRTLLQNQQIDVHQTGDTHSPLSAEVPDDFARTRGTQTQGSETAMEATLREGGEVKRGETVGERGAKVIMVGPGQTWQSILGERYGEPVSPAIIALVARMNELSPSQPLPENTMLTVFTAEQIYREAHPRDHRSALDRARFVVVKPGETWDDLADKALANIPSEQARRGVIRALQFVNGSHGPPPPVLVVPNWHVLSGACVRARDTQQRPTGTRELGPEAQAMLRQRFDADLNDIRDTPTAGAIYRPKPGEDLRHLALATYHEHLLAKGLSAVEAAVLLEDTMLVLSFINRLTTTEVSQYKAVYLPTAERLDQIVAHLRQEGVLDAMRRDPPPVVQNIIGQGTAALEHAAAYQRGEVVTPTARGPQADAELESAMQALLQEGTAQASEEFGYVSIFGINMSVGEVMAAFQYSVATSRAKSERPEEESFGDWVERTGELATAGEQKLRVEASERVAKEIEHLQALGIVDAKGNLTFTIQDPTSVAYEVYRGTLGTRIDPMVRARLIDALRVELAGTKGSVEQADVYSAMLQAGMATVAYKMPASIAMSRTQDELLCEALLEPEAPYPYDYEEVLETASDYEDPSKVEKELVAVISRNSQNFANLSEELRQVLMRTLGRQAEAIAQLKLNAREYDQVIKLLGEWIEDELAEGKVRGGTLPDSLAPSH